MGSKRRGKYGGGRITSLEPGAGSGDDDGGEDQKKKEEDENGGFQAILNKIRVGEKLSVESSGLHHAHMLPGSYSPDATQMSSMTQKFASRSKRHDPVSASQLSTVQSNPSSHTTGLPPTHAPSAQSSPLVQRSPSSQTFPSSMSVHASWETSTLQTLQGVAEDASPSAAHVPSIRQNSARSSLIQPVAASQESVVHSS
mgnify:CR=1 FL=1